MRKIMKRLVAAGIVAVGLVAGAAQASIICSGCNALSPGTYLGVHNATTFDLSTYQHAFQTISTAFTDYFVFDVAPTASGSTSANFTVTTTISGFAGALYNNAGSVCAGAPGTACTSIGLGSLIGSAAESSGQWQIVFGALTPGRYVIGVTGTTNANGNSAYTGQISFAPQTVPEPATLALLGVALAGLGFSRRRK